MATRLYRWIYVRASRKRQDGLPEHILISVRKYQHTDPFPMTRASVAVDETPTWNRAVPALSQMI